MHPQHHCLSQWPALLRTATALLCAVALVTSALPVWAAQGDSPKTQEKRLVAVLDLDVVGASAAEASAVTDRLRTELLRSGQFTLVDRSQMKSILKEQALQQTGCTSQECAVQVGQILGVRDIITGKVTKINDQLWQLSAQMVDVETAQTIKAETVIHQGTFVGLLEQGVNEMAQRLSGAKATKVATKPRGFGQLFVKSIPSGGQIKLDGIPMHKQTDTLLYQVPAGHHTVIVSNGKLAGAGTVTVTPNKIARVELNLRPRPAEVEVTSTPFEAQVQLDGLLIGSTPLTYESTPGEHKITVTKDGRFPVTKTVTLSAEQTNHIDANLAFKGKDWAQYKTDHADWSRHTTNLWVFGSLFLVAGAAEAHLVTKSNTRQDELLAKANATQILQDRQSLTDQITAEQKTGQKDASISKGSYGLATVLLGFAIWEELTEPEPPKHGTSTLNVSMVPYLNGGQSVALAWRF